MQLAPLLAEACQIASDFLARFSSSTPPTPAEIAHARKQLDIAVGVFHQARQLDSDHIRLDEINRLLKTPGPDAADLIKERREINARIEANTPHALGVEPITLEERHQRQDRTIEDAPDDSPIALGSGNAL